jgi:hypothetical protein
MSLPTAAAFAGAGPGAPLSAIGTIAIAPIDAALMALNSNPYFIGTMMLMLNLGGRFIAMEVTKSQEQFFQNPWVRRILIFTVLFVGTRNVLVAFWMSLIIILLLGYLFNENSSLCLFHLGAEGSSSTDGTITPTPSQLQAQMTPATPFTPEESEIYRRLNEKQLRFTATQRQDTTRTPPEFPKSLKDIYWYNMSMLKGTEGFTSTSGGKNPRF